MDWKRGEVASQGNHLCSWEVWGWWMGLGSPGPYGQVRGWMLLGGLGVSTNLVLHVNCNREDSHEGFRRAAARG